MSDTIRFRRARFKGKVKVWAQCDADGRLVVTHSVVKIRYKPTGADYSGRADNLEPMEPPEFAEAGAIPAARPAGGRPAAAGPTSARTRAAVRTRSEEPIVIYTDGASLGNPGRAGAGALLLYQGRQREISRYLGRATNNVAELVAVKMALESVKNREIPVDVHSDSTYVIGLLAQGWKARENTQLVEEIRGLLQQFSNVRFIKVKAHAGVWNNERVDELARTAAETGQSIEE